MKTEAGMGSARHGAGSSRCTLAVNPAVRSQRLGSFIPLEGMRAFASDRMRNVS